ncbi:MAG: glycosyltransferase family 4 protein [Bacteroidales bacterium]|nr:glycosyltransferase family 4 protein [Bacteroidales bacterium]MCM1146225.1 glycosyltransferase family 4 protein [Bacteroidales bacterium]MCM1205337.1 glycosyltransferase family 4 protein [Bacillota bacterium]MCM1509576.1 glycosyltransferase family 4 protein [Clostridium sp.]
MMNKKKITWITADYFIDVDFLLVPYLREYYDIDWYVLIGKGSRVQIPCDIDVKYMKCKFGYRNPLSIIEMYLHIYKLHLTKSDLIYSDVVGNLHYHKILLKLAGETPIIHAAHNVIAYDVWPQRLINCVDYIFSHHNYFQLFSKFTAKYFEAKFPQKSMFYCPMTLKGYGNMTTSNYDIDRNKVNLLFFGNIIANKRLDLLIETIKSLPKDILGKIHLTIAGDDKGQAGYYKQLIGDNKNITTYFKRIPDEEVAELFTKHDFLMLPYEDVAQSGPHMVAYYYNLPVIASDIDGFTERIVDGENGFIFKKNDLESFRQVIVRAVSMSKDEYTQMKNNLYTYAQANFGLEAVSIRYIDYFNNIMDKR